MPPGIQRGLNRIFEGQESCPVSPNSAMGGAVMAAGGGEASCSAFAMLERLVERGKGAG